LLFNLSKAQNVGIGTTTPKAPFNVALNKTVLFGDDTTNSSGTNKLIWLPAKGSFRVGVLSSTDTIGLYSTGMGWQTEANGIGSTAMGRGTSARGYYSTAIGISTIASGDTSTSMGYHTTASGNTSTAIGYNTAASGDYSTAMGFNTNASGNYSTAMGYGTTASGIVSTATGVLTSASGYQSTAMGFNTKANGDNSTAIGFRASTNGHIESICIGGGSSSLIPYNVANTADYQMMMYFDTYTFWSGTSGQGVDLPNNSNSWVSHCDKNKKENFEPLNGEDVLNKISNINYTSWNYKGLDPKKYRHYGIMAQDFYEAFCKDKYGIIGTDTTVNPIDMIGIDMAAIKALEKRTEKIELLENKNKKIESENAALLAKLEEMSAEIKKLQQTVEAVVVEGKTNNSVIAKK
jgi:hypothetical protein